MNDAFLRGVFLGPSPAAIALQVLGLSALTLVMTYAEINQRRRHIVISSHARIVTAAVVATGLNVTFFHLLLIAAPSEPVWAVIVTFTLVFFVGATVWVVFPLDHVVRAIATTALDDMERPEGTLYRGDASVIRRSSSRIVRLLILVGFFVTIGPRLSK